MTDQVEENAQDCQTAVGTMNLQCAYLNFEQQTITPAVGDTVNAYYRSSYDTQFCADGEYLNRLTYYPNVLVKGGEDVVVTVSDTENVAMYELPYRDLDTTPIGAFGTDEIIKSTSIKKGTTATVKLQVSTKRIAFVLGATQSVAISPSDIATFITEVSLPVVTDTEYYDLNSLQSIADLNDKITELAGDELPSTITHTFNYTGERIQLTHKGGWTVPRTSTNTNVGTSANYQNYCISIEKGEGSFSFFDLSKSNCTKRATYTATNKGATIYHANCATFVNKRYDESDLLPLLYVSVRNGADETNHPGQPSIDVYRVILTFNADDSVNEFTVTQVQTIWLPALTEANGHGYPNVVYDSDENCLWAVGRQTNSAYEHYGEMRLFRYAMPTSTDAEVSISTIDENYLLNYPCANTQGGVVIGDNIFFARGYATVKYIQIIVINKQTRSISNVVDLYGAGFTTEPEGALYYDDHLYLQGAMGSIYKFFF